MEASVKRTVVHSALIWVLLTCLISVVMIFRPGLDLAQVKDDYMGYWDFRLVFFLATWIPVSLPVWAFATYVTAKFKR